ncbi:28S ribosomal protein S24, mitochondrial [Protopterus annectens]|uniref:28S ribosomal protein S24, mitochondrial n=1 Tax=Protopterus annectens TaxID=7888 RepID=UPI001CFC319B|nr:28S ribosomal protein S24, mitochondrial [Protopterus annectens]
MAASLWSKGFRFWVSSWKCGGVLLAPEIRSIHSTVVCLKNRAARVRVGKGDKPVTYEEANPPHHIAHRKGWLSQHTSNLDNECGAAERTIEDVFIRRFIYGTFHGCQANEIVIKRRANMIIICPIFLQKLSPQKFYFLIGYTETVLSYLFKCPVKMEVQTVEEKVVYKYL